jgi:hypothetical protein
VREIICAGGSFGLQPRMMTLSTRSITACGLIASRAVTNLYNLLKQTAWVVTLFYIPLHILNGELLLISRCKLSDNLDSRPMQVESVSHS